MHNHSLSDIDRVRTKSCTPMLEQFEDTQVNQSGLIRRLSQILSRADTRYVHGPRDLNRHSKFPLFLRLHGSVMPRMITPMFLLGCWASFITYIDIYYKRLGSEPLLLTVLGLVVGLCLSFRSSTAYERYSEGRKTWASLMVQCRTLARLIWIHVPERPDTENEPERSKNDLLTKISAVNLIYTFAVALKHRLRFEPYADYTDLAPLIAHLDIHAKKAKDSRFHTGEKSPRDKSVWKKVGEFLSISFAMSNPRKALNTADAPLGNIPLEITTYLSAYVQEAATDTPGPSTISAIMFTQLMNTLAALTDVQTQADRILNTPLPIGYNILISQLVYLYTYLLPFQLLNKLHWVTIPATLVGSYVIIGIAAIGNELENPFGYDVNDLPLDAFCAELRQDLDCLVSKKPVPFRKIISCQENVPLWPLSQYDYDTCSQRDEDTIRKILSARTYIRT